MTDNKENEMLMPPWLSNRLRYEYGASYRRKNKLHIDHTPIPRQACEHIHGLTTLGNVDLLDHTPGPFKKYYDRAQCEEFVAQGLAIWKEDVDVKEDKVSINWERYLKPGTFGGKVSGELCDWIFKIYGEYDAGFTQTDLPEDAPSLKHLVGFNIEDRWRIQPDGKGMYPGVYFLASVYTFEV